MEQIITFIKGDRSSVETDFRDSLPVNMTGVARPVFNSQGYMIETPGLKEFGLGSGIDRGANWNERFSQHYRLSGTKFISVSQTGIKTELGTILGSDQATLQYFYSFDTQGIIADGKFYLYSPSGGFSQVVDPNVRTPIDGVWIDGYYCLTDGEFLYHTSIIAGTPVENVINPLALATAEFSPDSTVGCGRSIDNLWIAFNRYTIEFFQNVGGDTFAFERIGSRAVNCGLVATQAKAYLEDVWFFVGNRKAEALSVFGMTTGGAEKIATREVEKILAQYADSQLQSTVMETRQLDGYSYIILHLPNETLMFNYTLSKSVGIEYAWSRLTSTTNGTRWIAINGIVDPRIGKWVYGDFNDASLATLDETSAEQYGEIQEWYLDTPFINIESGSIDELQILTLPGWTATSDATVFLSLTYDGVSYSQERTLEYGLPSAYDRRFIGRRLGYVRHYLSFRLRGTSRSRMVFSEAKIKYG